MKGKVERYNEFRNETKQIHNIFAEYLINIEKAIPKLNIPKPEFSPLPPDPQVANKLFEEGRMYEGGGWGIY